MKTTTTAAGKSEQTLEELDRELRATMSSGLGSVFEIGDRVDVFTQSGTKFEGATVEDSNLSGIVIRSSEDRVFFVSFAGMDYAEIVEEDEEGGGEEDEKPDEGGEEIASAADGGAPVTPISTRSAA